MASGRIPPTTLSCDGPLEAGVAAAWSSLDACLATGPDGGQVLWEGGNYPGIWVESTASISAETLARFLPEQALATVRSVLDRPRGDGLLPYKVTGEGPSYRQIQMVTPLARSVWRVWQHAGRPAGFLADAYASLTAHDRWLATHRDTRGTGCVEAFCTFDTGHDRSPRFWHIPDITPEGDPARYDPSNPRVPLLAPDLTANVACQRRHLALMATELGRDATPWLAAAEASERALWDQCFDTEAQLFLDVDAAGRPLNLACDVLLRVLACGIGDDALFEDVLRRYLLDTRRFFAAYPFTSVALDDPRFDPDSTRNTWAGATNLLTLLRAPEAFEAHGRFVELTWAMWPTVEALCREHRFAQTLNPWTGEQGFTQAYSPAILTLLDFVERLVGILPGPGGELWFTSLTVPAIGHVQLATRTAYRRTVGGVAWELRVSPAGSEVSADGRVRFQVPPGVRLVTSLDGTPHRLIGMVADTVVGTAVLDGVRHDLAIGPNEVLEASPSGLQSVSPARLVLPQ